MPLFEKYHEEETRLTKLYRLNIIGSAPEKEFDDLCLLSSQICQAPIAHISFVSSNQLFYKAKVGFDDDTAPRNTSFCTHLLQQNDVMIIEDTLLDERFKQNAFVINEPFIRFYAGFPIKIDGHTIGALCVLDVVSRKLSQQQYFAMEVLSAQVTKLLELRLTNMEVQQRILDSLNQQDHLQTLVLSQSKILGYVAHDVRNPLTSLKSIIDLSNNQMLSNVEVEQVMGLLSKQLDATLDTLTNVIEWGQAQLDRQIPHIRPVDLHKLINRKIKNFEVALKAKGNTLQHNIREGYRVIADEYMLRFILRNLITNANKFTANGTITISVTDVETLSIITVADTGTGITSDILNKLFNPQKRVTQPGTDNEKGSGMGLVLVKEFIEKLGSTLQIKTEPGVGSTFSFALPKA